MHGKTFYGGERLIKTLPTEFRVENFGLQLKHRALQTIGIPILNKTSMHNETIERE